ncbi:hypothetical protein FGM00_11305 [Aggregatimonas sangjinii]|uniref:Uncharacterized protein n=1 Tax=Aggregatimonas sangjinii TaxID=2583587 RepID=A0A5B7SVI3_9FLAO|nr:hypothetical protein [Aggregatimonas sangjinii]QCX00664.1 hypothetical protein FGM00_11305 [Aggregatimonas sangjinii]
MKITSRLSLSIVCCLMVKNIMAQLTDIKSSAASTVTTGIAAGRYAFESMLTKKVEVFGDAYKKRQYYYLYSEVILVEIKDNLRNVYTALDDLETRNNATTVFYSFRKKRIQRKIDQIRKRLGNISNSVNALSSLTSFVSNLDPTKPHQQSTINKAHNINNLNSEDTMESDGLKGMFLDDYGDIEKRDWGSFNIKSIGWNNINVKAFTKTGERMNYHQNLQLTLRKSSNEIQELSNEVESNRLIRILLN